MECAAARSPVYLNTAAGGAGPANGVEPLRSEDLSCQSPEQRSEDAGRCADVVGQYRQAEVYV